MRPATIKLREATGGDAATLGALHVRVWRETYAGILSPATLAEPSVEARSAMWATVLAAPTDDAMSVFVVESDNAMIGFAACSGQRDAALRGAGFDGEIGAIYVARMHQRLGVGGMLIDATARRLAECGRTGVALWVLCDNVSARAFYERLGGAVVGGRTDGSAGAASVEIAYGWRDLARLMR